MFVGQAHSLAQQSRLAITLAWVAGYTNIVAVLTCGRVISYVSGTASDVGQRSVAGEWREVGLALFLLAAFGAGAAASGMMTEVGKRRGWESIYVLPMACEAALLAAFAVLVELHGRAAVASGVEMLSLAGVGSLAMGLQNATITRISGGVVRTTHVTGVLTDLGLELARLSLWLRDRAAGRTSDAGRGLRWVLRHVGAARQVALLASVVGSFVVGAGLGALMHRVTPEWAMFPPVAFLLWIVYVDATRPIAEVEVSDLVARELGLPASLGVYRLAPSERRAGLPHRLPDLSRWGERLPRGVRVVVLDLDATTHLDEFGADELAGTMRRLRSGGRAMVIAGLTRAHYDRLRAAEGGDAIDPQDLCADLELAVARGLNVLEDAGGAAGAGA
jgi:uncharacterized membrane protein YoaK (UPF0700 family)